MSKGIVKRLCSASVVFLLVLSLGLEIFATPTAEEQQRIDELEQMQQELQEKIDAEQEEINKMRLDIEDKEKYAAQLTEQIDNYQAQIDVLNLSIAELEPQIAEIEAYIDLLNAEIKGYEDDISKNKAEINSTEAEIADLYNELRQRLYDLYVNGSMSEIELLLDFDRSNDFSSYLILLELNKQRTDRDDEICNELNNDIAQLEELNKQNEILKASVEVKRDEQQIKADELNEKKSLLETKNNELINSKNELVTLQQEAYAYIKELDAESQACKDLIASYEADIKRFDNEIDKIINGASSGSGDISSVPGGFIWPLQYDDVYISSNYGYRYDPISGVYKLHGGTDTCCWSGTMGKAVRASADGTVIISTWHSAYGYYVGIDHGNGIVTIYAHNSSLNVSVGQSVSQGDIVAYAGSTGYSTGAHCHFEVRVNGNKVDPSGYASLP